MGKRKNKEKPLVPMTASKLAKVLGVSRQVISAQRRPGNDSPALDDVAGWTAHLAAHGRVGSQAGGDLKKQIAVERLAILRETKAKMEMENAQRRGETVAYGEARRQASEAAALYFAELDRMCRELPPIIKGLDEIGVFRKLEQRREEIRETLNRAFDAVGEQSK